MRLARGAVLALGFGVLGVLGATELVLRRGSGPVAVPVAVQPLPVSRRVSRLRVLLGAAGVLIAGYGAVVALRIIPPADYLGIVIWLAAAVVLHDAVLVPAVSVLRAAAERAGRRLPRTAVNLVEAGFLTGGTLTLIAVPEIWSKHLGAANPTVLPGDYGLALALTWVVIAVLTVGGVALVAGLARRHASASPLASGTPSRF